MAKTIAGFFKEYRFLSNFWPTVLRLDGIEYVSLEHAYQAAKTTNQKDKLWVAAAEGPGSAKKRGRRITIRPDWDEVKLAVMESLVREKFSWNRTKHSELSNLLLATGDLELIEANTWGDTFWGRCNGVGKNHLGLILMKVREELKCN